MKFLNTKNIIYIGLFITVIYVSGLVRIYLFSVPFTLQTLAVMLAACFLGLKRGLAAVLIYIIMGLAGLPVFTKGGGIFYVLELSFGYILGFISMTVIAGILKDRAKKSLAMLCTLLFISSVSMLLTGAVYAYFLLSYTSSVSSISALFSSFFLVFLPAELIKSLAAGMLYYRLKKYIIV